MNIYTKTGDTGTTSLWGGVRIRKDASQVEAYGSVDELTVHLGAVQLHKLEREDGILLTNVQRDLHSLMAELSNANVDLGGFPHRLKELEVAMDTIEKNKPTSPKFILIQGSPASIAFHMARVVCRRAERRLISFISEDRTLPREVGSGMIQYLNRLSDLLYAMGRKYNTEEEVFL